jgi:hypothetical protein
MLFKSGEVIAEEGYPRPAQFNGLAIATGDDHDWAHAIYMNERLQLEMLEEAIQRVLQEHNVRTEQVLLQVLHSAIGQPEGVWSAPTGNVFQLVGLGEVNDVEDQRTIRENLFAPLRRCIREQLCLIYEDPQLVAYNSRSIQLQDGGFLCRRLNVNRWQAVLTFFTGEPNDTMDVTIQGRDNGGNYRVDFRHSREWRMFRYRNP